MRFCFKCPKCGKQDEVIGYRTTVLCTEDDTPMIRDYRAEATGVQVFTSALGDGKVETRVVKPDDDVSRTGPIIK